MYLLPCRQMYTYRFAYTHKQTDIQADRQTKCIRKMVKKGQKT